VKSTDYARKLWGGHQVKPTPTYLGGLKLRYCLDDLVEVRGQVLEVGCGGGAMLRAIKAYRSDLEVYGCDFSWRSVQMAHDWPEAINYTVGDAHHLPLKSESYAAVVMLDVLEHLPDPRQALTEIYRLLMPGGRFHLFVPCEGDLRTLHGLLWRLGWQAKEKLIGHIQHFTPHELQTLLSELGFQIKRSRWSGHAVNQVVDVAYFTWIDWRGRQVTTSVESYLNDAPPGMIPWLVNAAKSSVAVASYYESRLLINVPGSGVHLLCEKPGKVA
jgi:ubiquinone/menaquinone biosynthesis C-methylase UbiE